MPWRRFSGNRRLYHRDMNFQEEKSRLREAIAQRIAAMSERDRAAESRSVCRRIREELRRVIPSSPRHQPKGVSRDNAGHAWDDIFICGSIPLKTEVDILPLLKELFAEGYPLFLPRFEAGALTFRRAEDLSNLPKGALNIPEPLASAELLPTEARVIVLVPGRAFDLKGGRLGRGNGGYDRWIKFYRAQNPDAGFLGIGFECQIVREIPAEEHDERMDSVLTARGKMM